MVYFPFSPKQCFCTTLQNIQTKIMHMLNFICYETCCGWQFCLLAGHCAPAHWARDTIELLQRETPYFISPELCPQQSKPEFRWLQDLGSHAAACVRSTMSTNSNSDWLTFGAVCSKVLSTLLSASGESVCRRVFAEREHTADICCRLFRQRNETIDRQSMYNVFWSF